MALTKTRGARSLAKAAYKPRMFSTKKSKAAIAANVKPNPPAAKSKAKGSSARKARAGKNPAKGGSPMATKTTKNRTQENMFVLRVIAAVILVALVLAFGPRYVGYARAQMLEGYESNLRVASVSGSFTAAESAEIASAPEVVVQDAYNRINQDNLAEIRATFPADWEAWLDSQVFDPDVNACDPWSFTENRWWTESSAEDGFRATGGDTEEFDIDLRIDANSGMKEIAVVWGTSTNVNGANSGQFAVLQGVSVNDVTINDGAYRIGVDLTGHFPDYWSRVLECRYPGGDWTPVYVGANQD